MNDDITFLTYLSQRPSDFQNVNDFLNGLGYKDDTDKISFLESLQTRRFIILSMPPLPMFQTTEKGIRNLGSTTSSANAYNVKLDQPGREYLRQYFLGQVNSENNKTIARSTFWYTIITLFILFVALYQCK